AGGEGARQQSRGTDGALGPGAFSGALSRRRGRHRAADASAARSDRSAMTEVALWQQVTKRYRDLTAVRDVSLSLQAGEVTALVGHNGAGKTTLIKLLLGLVRPSAGRVSISGADPAGRQGAQARRSIGFLPENVAFH